MSSRCCEPRVPKARHPSFHYLLPLVVIGHALCILLDLGVGKIILGLVVVGYAPGALLIQLLFPSTEELDALERVILSIVFSFLLCTSLGLLLNRVPQGLSPTHVYPTVWGFVISLFLIKLCVDTHRRAPSTSVKHSTSHLVRQLLMRYSSKELVVYLVTGVIAVLCASFLLSLVIHVENNERFTEFYALGVEGTADPSDLDVQVGHPSQFLLGISNHTGATQDYYVEIICLERQVFSSDEIVVPDSGTEYKVVSLQLPTDLADTRLEVRLYMNGETSPTNVLYLQTAK